MWCSWHLERLGNYIANRNFDIVQSLAKGVKIIAGSFAPNGTSAVAATSNKGIGFSVARTNTGIFTITLEDSYVDLLAANCSVALSSPDDKHVQFGAIDVVTAKTVVLNVWPLTAFTLSLF